MAVAPARAALHIPRSGAYPQEMTTGLDAAKALAAEADPAEAARRCGIGFTGGEDAHFALPLLGRPVRIGHPGFEAVFSDDGRSVPGHVAAVLLRHIAVSDGTPPTGRWVSFAELPEGRFYVSAWRGYTGTALVRHFGERAEDLRSAAASLGARPLDLPGEVVLLLPALPRMPLALTFWSADDEFEARADILYDASASHHLPIDGCALLGAIATHALMAADPGEG
ncbi:MAG: DUF3786 domain-containing protein [Coriobacteriia bacterium]|nr:DUF3786 domain-containing protein [Coriobacteriia bacterium]